MYKASLKVLGRTYTSEGRSIVEALENLQPGNIAGMSILTVNSKERVLPAPVIKRAYNTAGLTREVALKTLGNMFEGV